MLYEYKGAFDFKKVIQKLKHTVLLPIGRLESRIPSLTIETENKLTERMATWISKEMDCLQLPSLSYGQVRCLTSIPENTDMSHETLINVLVDIGRNLYLYGFRLLVMINGYPENQQTLREVAHRLHENYPSMSVYLFYYPEMLVCADLTQEPLGVSTCNQDVTNTYEGTAPTLNAVKDSTTTAVLEHSKMAIQEHQLYTALQSIIVLLTHAQQHLA
ncbi:hypothetical protein GCM10011391_01770 [Pullulanibacillus camelliae]|uniref:Uncharacterized protein n=1 Tax=Pullulanibacillus camelliae TaxID=1707096 RepID=A0A8J2VJD9_9BACL|nr:creatininase family protein [Pullulanibacillus camelliae]GGE27082.1 hypothetical protein GCM10011391_01770 [Pullulanibacillus camelliae]